MKHWKYTFGLTVLILAGILIAIFQSPDSNLHVIACNVGLGDAVLITYGKTQILTDGGPDKSVLDCLGRHMPFWDREIELIISTHPDSDHLTGLVDVIRSYNVDKILINPIDSGTKLYQLLIKEVGGRGISVINPKAGMELGFDLIYLEILNPNDSLFENISTNEPGNKLSKYKVSKDTNLYSIAYFLSYKGFKGLFLGDIPPDISDGLAEIWSKGAVEYIKIPHHGSVNGITENLIKVTKPNIAVVSVGKNSWGFPKQEILDLLNKYNINILRTDRLGDIEIVTDGQNYRIK